MKHTYKAYHKSAIVRVDEFCQVMSNPQSDIWCQMNQAMADRVTSNRMKLALIVQTIVFVDGRIFHYVVTVTVLQT